MRVKHYCVLQKQVVQSKTLFQLIQIKFLASGNHSLQFSQIPYSENIFLNKSFIPATGNLVFVQSGNSMLLFRAFSVQRIFQPEQTISYKVFQGFLPEKDFFSVQWKRVFDQILLPGYWGWISSLMETITLLESFFLLAETVTAICGNQFLKTELILADGN